MNRAFVSRLQEFLDTDNMAEIARQTGIPYNTLKNYTGNAMPSADVLAQIAITIGASLNWLLLGIGPKELPSDDNPPSTGPDTNRGSEDMDIKLAISLTINGKGIKMINVSNGNEQIPDGKRIDNSGGGGGNVELVPQDDTQQERRNGEAAAD